MRSGRRNGQLWPLGFPIRKSSDHSLVADSPRLIAGSNVLHQLLVPRHPPCALKNLAYTTDILLKMLASTVQFSRYGRCQPIDGISIPPSCWPDPRLRSAPRGTAPVSSGPNSVLTQPPCLAARSVPPAVPAKALRGGRTSRGLARQPGE